MEDRYSIQKLLELRKLTRAIADLVRGEMKTYLATLSPLFRPAMVLGEYVHGSIKGSVKGAENNFKELRSLYESLAGSKQYALSRDLPIPLEILSTTPELIPMEYAYVARGNQESKIITISSPLTWVLCYANFPLSRFRELLAAKARNTADLTSYLVHYLVLHSVISKQPGLRDILGALNFKMVLEPSQDLGNLPIVYIHSSITTQRPSDSVIIESTEISGMNLFEEIVNLEDVKLLRNPLQEKLTELVQKFGVSLT